MHLDVIFVGTKFTHNKPLEEYVLRNVEKVCSHIGSIRFYKDSQSSLFLDLEAMFDDERHLLIVTSKQSFPTIGKLICTITEDNLVLKENQLIPSNATLYAYNSYVIEYAKTQVNVLCMDEMQTLPEILLECEETSAVIQLFEEDEASAKILLDTLSQTYEVRLEFVTLVSGWIEVHIAGKKHGDIASFITSAKQLLPKKIIAASNIMLYIIERLSQKNKTLTFAESCTGGLLSYYLTKNNRASNILNGALVTYSNDIKTSWLAVDEAVLERYGAVSAAVVEQMSEGAMSVAQADYALSISGIAGDGGGTPQKPVGTVYIGVRAENLHQEEHFLFHGDRNYVQHQSVLQAMKMLLLIDKEMFF